VYSQRPWLGTCSGPFGDCHENQFIRRETVAVAERMTGKGVTDITDGDQYEHKKN